MNMSFIIAVIEFIKSYKYVILSGVVLTVLSGYGLYMRSLYNTIDDLKNENKVLSQDNDTLHGAVTSQNSTITKLEEEFKNVSNVRNELDQKNKKIDEMKIQLDRVIRREQYGKNSLEVVIAEDTKNRVEKLINEATKKVFRCIELLTGDQLGKDEKITCEK